MDKDFKNMTLEQICSVLQQIGQRPFMAGYIFSFVHQKNCQDINEITPLSKNLRQKLIDSGFIISALKIEHKQTDPDRTVKYLFTLPDDSFIEAVRMTDKDRTTLCISSQAGCRMGCLFCATGQLPFQRNLTAAEIIDQVYQIEADTAPAQNIVYMGMGEPLDNLDAVIQSIRLLNDTKGRNFGIRHITLSTCGLSDQIRKLANLDITPRLALSLHAATDSKRNQLMRIAKGQPLSAIFHSLRDYQKKTSKRITFEYCMIDGLNDTDADFGNLIHLIGKFKCNVNLIELNPFPGCPFKPSPPQRIKLFAAQLQKAGIETVIRFKRGTSIKAACGQLGAEHIKKNT